MGQRFHLLISFESVVVVVIVVHGPESISVEKIQIEIQHGGDLHK